MKDMYSDANLFQQCLLLAYLHFIKEDQPIYYICVARFYFHQNALQIQIDVLRS